MPIQDTTTLRNFVPMIHSVSPIPNQWSIDRVWLKVNTLTQHHRVLFQVYFSQSPQNNNIKKEQKIINYKKLNKIIKTNELSEFEGKLENCGKSSLEGVITELSNYLEEKVLQATEIRNIRINNWWSRELDRSKMDIKNLRRKEYRSRGTAENELIKGALQNSTKEYKRQIGERKMSAWRKFVVEAGLWGQPYKTIKA